MLLTEEIWSNVLLKTGREIDVAEIIDERFTPNC